MAELLSSADVNLFHAARMRMRELAQVASHEAWDADRPADYGRAADACDRAEDAIFHALNIITNHLDDPNGRVALDLYTEALR